MDKITDDMGEEGITGAQTQDRVVCKRLVRHVDPHVKLEMMKKIVGAGSSLVWHVLVLVWLAR